MVIVVFLMHGDDGSVRVVGEAERMRWLEVVSFASLDNAKTPNHIQANTAPSNMH